MVKGAKIDDIKRPDKVLPSATSRPLLIVDQAMAPATDPMLATTDDTSQPPGSPDDPAPLSHTAKTIKPLDSTDTEAGPEDADPDDEVLKPTKPAPPEKVQPTSDDSKPAAHEPAFGSATTDSEPAAKDGDDIVRDPEAAQTAAEAAAAEARAKRDTELEEVIASGKYAVPVNAVQLRRSRIATTMLCVLALLLAVVLLDAVCDVGLLNVPDSVPHTHFFSKS